MFALDVGVHHPLGIRRAEVEGGHALVTDRAAPVPALTVEQLLVRGVAAPEDAHVAVGGSCVFSSAHHCLIFAQMDFSQLTLR
jgi:hypothetical protein